MEANDVAIRPAKHQVILGDGTHYTYGAKQRTTSTTSKVGARSDL